LTTTECVSKQFVFEGFEKRPVVAGFDGGAISSDAGALLLREVDRVLRLSERVAACFSDYRNQARVEHAVKTMVAQRIHGIALGYEDLNDHDDLRRDPVLALMSTTLEERARNVAPLAGKSTLNRLEHAPGTLKKRKKTLKQKLLDGMAQKYQALVAAKEKAAEAEGVAQEGAAPAPIPTPAPAADRYHKLSHDPEALEAQFPLFFLEAHKKAPTEIVFDLDGTDDPTHGEQEGNFFNGYYDKYCYMPLYIFCGRDLLVAKLRKSNVDGAEGAKEEVERLVKTVRERWPRVKITVRGDSGFCRDDLMTWCEQNKVEFVFGCPRNARLNAMIAQELKQAELAAKLTETKTARVFKELRYKTLDSWSCERRVVAKAEWTEDKANPRFVVASEGMTKFDARGLYEDFYCERGNMENRIKECQLDLMADRTSTATLRANQLRLWFASLAYVLMTALRRLGLRHTEFEDATAGTIRTKLLKIGALVTVSVRRVKVAMASAFPRQNAFALAHCRLRNMAA
jgi:hypothetical protein